MYRQYYKKPTVLSASCLPELCEAACDRAASLGLLTRTNDQKSTPKLLQVASITLDPAPIPKKELTRAIDTQVPFNKLLSQLVNHHQSWITDALADVDDDFIQKLLSVRASVKSNQFPQVGNLQFFRNDYMVDATSGVKNIEFNTIAVSICGLSEGTPKVHEHVRDKINKTTKPSGPSFVNKPLTNMLGSFKKAFEMYGETNASVLFIVESGPNWNIMDIRKMEYGLNELGIRTISRSFKQMRSGLSIDENDGKLMIDGKEIAIAYYRTGYDPTNYDGAEDYDVRRKIEVSKCIKCPNLDYHLLTFKRIQIELSKPGVLESFLQNSNDVDLIRSTFARIWQASDQEGYQLAIKNPENYVLKEQTEGGSSILVDGDIPVTLKAESDNLSKWVIMERVRPIEFDTVSCHHAEYFRAISELGIYSAIVESVNSFESEFCGYLVRSKQKDALAGGFAVGVASCDDLYFCCDEECDLE